MNISPSIFSFLKNLKENNTREWFHDNKATYEEVRQEFLEFTGLILNGLIKIDRKIPADLPVSKCAFRIYRDIRFSKDKTPYKGYFSAAFSVTGRSTELPGYYIHIEPANSFISAGIWNPDKEKLAAIRQEIDYNGNEFRQIIGNLESTKTASLDHDDKLKKAPNGYSTDHPDIDFLRLKSFTASKSFTDEEMLEKSAGNTILKNFHALQPFQAFLYQSVEMQ